MKLTEVLLALLTAALCFAQTGERTAEVALEVGADAPAFRLNDHEGAAVEVGGARETWTVVAFYPKALTPG